MTDTFAYASAFQLWRLKACGLIRLVDWPDEELEQPLERTEAKEVLVAAAARSDIASTQDGEQAASETQSTQVFGRAKKGG